MESQVCASLVVELVCTDLRWVAKRTRRLSRQFGKRHSRAALEASRNKRILKKTSVKSSWLTKRSKAFAILRLNFKLVQRKRVTATTARHHSTRKTWWQNGVNATLISFRPLQYGYDFSIFRGLVLTTQSFHDKRFYNRLGAAVVTAKYLQVLVFKILV